MMQEEGMGVIEVVMIIVVLVVLAILFKGQINTIAKVPYKLQMTYKHMLVLSVIVIIALVYKLSY